MKRTLSLLLVALMLAVLVAVPAAAYGTPSVELWPSEWHADLNLAFKDATAAPLAPMTYEPIVNGSGTNTNAINTSVVANIKNGAFTFVNKSSFTANSAYVRNLLTAPFVDNASHSFLTENGSTLDIAVKFNALPELSSDIMKIDSDGNFTSTGITSTAISHLGRDVGFRVVLHTVAPYRNADGTIDMHTSGPNSGKSRMTDYNISFVRYTNSVLNTNAAIILTSSATSFTASTVREVYFCNLDVGADAEYHRYTFVTDYDKGLAGEDMIALYIDGEKAATFSAPAKRNYSATAGEYVEMIAGTSPYCVNDADGFSETNVTIDQLSVYGLSLTPKNATMSTFVEEAPLRTEDFADALARAKALNKSDYSKKTWKPLAEALEEADELPPVEEMNKQNTTQAQLDSLTQRINEAITALLPNKLDGATVDKRLYIAYSFFNASDAASYKYFWQNSSVIFTDPNYDISNYTVQTSDLTAFTQIVCAPTETEGEYKITAIYPASMQMSAREIKKAPAGGFIICTNNNIVGTSSSRYASQIFGDKNAEIVAQLAVDQIVRLENVEIKSDTAAKLATSGDWRSRYDPKMLDGTIPATSSGPDCEAVLEKYPSSSFTWRDYFNDFETQSALVISLPTGAYMEDFNLIMGKVSAAVETEYTPESWKALQDVLATVDVAREDLTQDMIDDWTDELNAAYNGLVKVEAGDTEDEDSDNPGTGEDTGDTHVVFVVLGVIAFLAIACVTVLVIGRRRGNF